jgi:hypothetical protein
MPITDGYFAVVFLVAMIGFVCLDDRGNYPSSLRQKAAMVSQSSGQMLITLLEKY